MTNLVIAFFAYLIDRVFGEFSFIKHPIIHIGEFINFFEEKFYKDSVFRGLLLVLAVVSVVGFISGTIYLYLGELSNALNIVISSILTSMFLSHKMLYDSVKEVLVSSNKKEAIAMLVSRDTAQMSESDINKASIETYAENLSDGVIAPLFYLLLFGFVGIVVYKAVNTLDSMVGYRNSKYENYGKVSAILDDILNFIPSRITAIIIMIIFKKSLFNFYEDGKKHDSPNAGHPITAMALGLDVSLGGDTIYDGVLKKKAYFGDGEKEITTLHVEKALNIRKTVDIIIFTLLLLLFILYKVIITV